MSAHRRAAPVSSSFFVCAMAVTLLFTGVLIPTAGARAVGPVPPARSAATVPAVPRPDHTVVLILENHSSGSIVGNAQAPYLNELAASGASLTQSYGVSHPSQPNYLALFSGSVGGVTDDSCPQTLSDPNLATQLVAAGLTFATYSEDLPSVGYTGCSAGKYARKHNPAVDYPAVAASANQPLTAFPTDFSTLPTVSYVVPNLTNDMHDGTIAQGDAWVQAHLKGYRTWAQTHNSLLVVTWDEDDYTSANRIPTFFVGAGIAPGSYAERITHYDVLRTLQDAYGLGPLGASATASPILDIWAVPTGAPTAAFTVSCAGLSCTADGSSSTGGSAGMASYTWDWGDGSATTAGSPNTHRYAAAGDFQVLLTVRNNVGLTGTVTHGVSPRNTADPAILATDTFARTVTGGFGTADVGGAWTVSGAAGRYSVSGGTGVLGLPTAGTTSTATLAGVRSTDTDLRVSVATDKLANNNGTYIGLIGRQVSATASYSATVRIRGDGVLLLSLGALQGSSSAVTLRPAIAVPGVVVAPGGVLRTRLQVTGTEPTTVRLKVWPRASTEPAAWQLSTTDSYAGLQRPGSLALNAYLSSGSTNAPVLVRISELTASTTVAVPAPANQPPVAIPAVSCLNLVCTADGSASTDTDGSVGSYVWNWGDGGIGTGASTSHAYQGTGTYLVNLTVTDDKGLSNSGSVSVTPTLAQNVPPRPSIGVTCVHLSCSADSSGSVDPDGTVTGYRWDWGDGSATTSGVTSNHTFAAGGAVTVSLTVTDNRGGTATISQTVVVSAPPPAAGPFVSDTFARTVTGGWGSAPVGGPWTISGGAANFSVANGVGVIAAPKAGSTVSAMLSALSPGTSTDFTVAVATDKLADNNGTYFTFFGRRLTATLDYDSRVRVTGTGAVVLSLGALTGTSTAVALTPQVVIPGLTLPAGGWLKSRLQVVGSNPTTIRARVWSAAAAEPTGWSVTATDATPALQLPGATGLSAYLSSSATNAPVTVRVRDVEARPVSP